MANDPMERCIACNGVLLDDDMVYDDESGGTIHERCCGPERGSYVNEDGEPLKDGEPIPRPYRYGDVLESIQAAIDADNGGRP